MRKIAIIGAGNIGRALAAVLKRKAEIDLWDIAPAKVKGQKELKEIIPEAEAVFLCVPSAAVLPAVRSITPLLRRKTIVVGIAKGIEAKSGETMDRLLAKSLPRGQAFSLLSGPMLAGELMRDLCGSAFAASSSPAVRKKMETMFRGTELYVCASADLRGVALAGVLKNIYALVLGAAEGFGFGWNAKGVLVAQAVDEMRKIIPQLGGKRDTVLGPAGLGDLVATGMSPDSRNRRSGMALAKGSGTLPSEGTSSLPWMLAYLGGSRNDLPLLMAAASLVRDPHHGKGKIKKLISGAQ